MVRAQGLGRRPVSLDLRPHHPRELKVQRLRLPPAGARRGQGQRARRQKRRAKRVRPQPRGAGTLRKDGLQRNEHHHGQAGRCRRRLSFSQLSVSSDTESACLLSLGVRTGRAQLPCSQHNRHSRASGNPLRQDWANADPSPGRPWLRHNAQPRLPPGYPQEPFANPRVWRSRIRVRSAPDGAPPKGVGGAPSYAPKRSAVRGRPRALRASERLLFGRVVTFAHGFLPSLSIVRKWSLGYGAAPSQRLVCEEHTNQDRHSNDQERDGQVSQSPGRSVLPLAVSAPNAANPNQATAFSVSRSMTAAIAPTSQSAVAIHIKSLKRGLPVPLLLPIF